MKKYALSLTIILLFLTGCISQKNDAPATPEQTGDMDSQHKDIDAPATPEQIDDTDPKQENVEGKDANSGGKDATGDKKDDVDENDDLTLENPEGVFHRNFKTVKPVDWKEIEIPPAIFMYLPQGADPTDPRAEKITIVANHLPEDQIHTLEDLVHQGIEESKNLMPDLTLAKDPVEARLGSMDGLEYQFTATVAGQKMRFIQILAIEFNNVYAVTYSCPVDNCNYHDVFSVMVARFEPVDSTRR